MDWVRGEIAMQPTLEHALLSLLRLLRRRRSGIGETLTTQLRYTIFILASIWLRRNMAWIWATESVCVCVDCEMGWEIDCASSKCASLFFYSPFDWEECRSNRRKHRPTAIPNDRFLRRSLFARPFKIWYLILQIGYYILLSRRRARLTRFVCNACLPPLLLLLLIRISASI